MLSCFIDTCSSTKCIALFRNRVLLGRKTWKAPYKETEKVLPAMVSLLKKYRLDWKNLDAILVVNGPGSFSSVRIGVVIANVLAMSLKIPVFPCRAELFAEKDQKGVISAIMDAVEKRPRKSGKLVEPFYHKAPNITL